MRVSLNPAFGVRVVAEQPLRLEVTGPLDPAAVRLLDGLLDAVRDDDEQPVVLDLTGADLVDAAGLAAVVARIGEPLRLVSPA